MAESQSGQDRTELATPRRREHARERGNVARSLEVSSVVAFAAGILGLHALGPDIAGGLAAGNRFAETLELFAIAASLGSTESLVVPPAIQQPRDLTAEQRVWSAITPGTVRLSIGIEDPDDLIADLEQALARSQA